MRNLVFHDAFWWPRWRSWHSGLTRRRWLFTRSPRPSSSPWRTRIPGLTWVERSSSVGMAPGRCHGAVGLDTGSAGRKNALPAPAQHGTPALHQHKW